MKLMENIKKVFRMRNREKRYNKFIDWIFSEIFNKKICILECNGFSEKRTIRKSNKKLIAKLIFSKDPESSAFRGPAVIFTIFENQKNKKWYIDLLFNPTAGARQDYKNLDFVNFINPELIKIIRKFIHEN